MCDLFKCDETKFATEIFPSFLTTLLKSEWLDELIAKCEAKANKTLTIHEIMFVLDYTVSLLEVDEENDYVEQTVECSGISGELIPENHPVALLNENVDIDFRFSENTTNFLEKCEKIFGEKFDLIKTLFILRYAIGFNYHEVDIDDLLDAMSEADI